MKIYVTIIPTDLVRNFLLPFLLFFLTNQKQESNFQQAGGLITRSIPVFLFIGSCALLQSHVEFNRLYKEIFLQIIPVPIIVS